MTSPLAVAIFAYIARQQSEDHPDGEGPKYIYLTDIEKLIQQHSMKTEPTTPAATHKPLHGGLPETKIEHWQMVQKLIKTGSSILEGLTETGAKLMHATFGISGEAGELLDAVKKHIIYGKPLDRENVIEELGDLEFYLEDLRRTLGITRDETIQANMSKLAKRYPGFNYSDESAIKRADKQPDGLPDGE